MKKFFLILCFIWPCFAHAVYSYAVTLNKTDLSLVVHDSIACESFLAKYNEIHTSLTALSCSTDPIMVGTSFARVRDSDGVAVTSVLVSSIVRSLICTTGTHYDSSTDTCVDDVNISVASCLPSIRTIAPCPSGFAPTNAIPVGSGAPAPFTSAMDGMPLQDMLYAIGIAICGLMGVAVGIKLV